ncbi:excinuclease ABC subunit UvrA [Patescibacteria group bacterium]|nr:excinuclease ABC subunit UvrA [Patescibacteria group bacterium]MBU1868663.1 excinuclease ABC subunit UvrA [Patescibacteria group bacterium]
MNTINIKGARENNLKNIDVVIPRNRVVCFVGVSGSGKSTIAFDIIARESERQYFESLSTYARRYLSKNNKPDIDSISGISSTVKISQARVRSNPRSTVGTLTESYNYLRLLFSRVGLPTMDSTYFSFNHPFGACPQCKGLGRSVEVNLDKILDVNKSLNEGALKPGEWYVGGRQWSIIGSSGYFDMDKKIKDYCQEELDKLLNAKPVLLDSQGAFIVNKWTYQGIVYRIMHRNTKVHRGPSKSDLKYFDFIDCPACKGGKLNAQALSVRVNGKSIGEVANMPLTDCLEFIKNVGHPHAEVIKPRLTEQLEHLVNAGVGYLSLNRSADTLSGGEAQRVKMARQLGCDLIETIYVLDEPTAGLHPKDVAGVVNNLKSLCKNSNTILVVEHDEAIIKSSDHIVEIGPGGGKEGGRVIAQGVLNEIVNNPKSVTAKYLVNSERKDLKDKVRTPIDHLKIVNATKHNLKNLNVKIPCGVLVALTGVSGSGKSSLVEEIIAQHGERITAMDQKQIGNTKRGCIATYIGAFDEIRKIFAKSTNMSVGLFSFNSKGGCANCKGVGYINMDMNFLGNVKIRCDKCGGTRYKEKVLRYRHKGRNIAQILEMTAREVKGFFEDKKIIDAMDLLINVGLDYIEMGQTLDTLSGGESQRLKLASRLQKENEFYILDEPTSGLHFADLDKLMRLLNKLVDNGNTVLIVEHNLDVIRQADWIIDLGPGGGDKGGRIVAQGTPEDICNSNNSHTGRYLKEFVNQTPSV